MNRFLERARTLWLAVAAVGLTGGGGLVVAFSLRGAGPAAVLGIVSVTAGLVTFMSTVFLVLRREHDTGQGIARRVTKLAKGGTPGRRASLDTAELEIALDHHARRVIAAVDARIIGLYEREQSS